MSRPSDYIDATGSGDSFSDDGAGGGVTNPKLGAGGWLRWSWRQLTSMRTALLLLLLLAIAAVPGSLFPQRSSDPNGVTQYFANNPRISPVLDAMQLFDVYSSFWFSAIYLLLFVSLIGCVLPRTKHHFEALGAKPPKTPANLARLPGYQQRTLAAGVVTGDDVTAAARKLLKGSRYRTVVMREEAGTSRSGRPVAASDSVSAERGYLRETGNLIFHSALVGVLVCVALGGLLGYTGQKLLVIDQTLVNAVGSYDTYNPGRFVNSDALTPFAVQLNDFTVEYDRTKGAAYGRTLDFTADVTSRQDGVETPGVIKVNGPLDIGGTSIYLLGNGYAPVVTVRDPDGVVVFQDSVPFLPQDTNLTSVGVIKVPDGLSEQVGMTGFFYPSYVKGSTGAGFSTFPDLDNPLLTLQVYTGDLGIDDGKPKSVYELDTTDMVKVAGVDAPVSSLELTIGQSVDLPGGLGSISLDAAPRFASLDVHYDPAQGWVFVFVVAALAGLITSLFIPRRRMWVKATEAADGSIVVEYAGLARGEDPGLDAAVADLARKHATALKLDQ